MSHRISATLVALVLQVLVAARVLEAQDVWKPDTQIGDFQFSMPDGWKRLDKPDGHFLVPADLAQGSVAYIEFLPSSQTTGDLRSWFDARWAEWQKQFRVVQAGEVSTEHHPNGFDVVRIDARVSSPQLSYSEFVFAAAKVGNVVEAYYFLSNADAYRYRDALTNFEHSLSFANAAPSAPALRGTGGLRGLYVGYKMRGMIGLETHFEHLAFFPDGNVIRYLPEGGLAHFDMADAVKKSRDYCGRYRVEGRQVTIAWGNNTTEAGARSATGLTIGGDEYFLVPASDGLKLDGAYRREGPDLAAHFIQFTPDGHFDDNGMLGLVFPDAKDPSPGRGTYQIGDNTLTLAYADGRAVALSFFVFGDDATKPQPHTIHVNTYSLSLGP